MVMLTMILIAEILTTTAVITTEQRVYSWRAAVTVLNKQSWTADKRWSSSMQVGQLLTTPHGKKLLVIRGLRQAVEKMAMNFRIL
jgi:hypothetical protein